MGKNKWKDEKVLSDEWLNPRQSLQNVTSIICCFDLMTPIDCLTPYLRLLPIKSKREQFSENE
jgi:hypothetical protein